MNHTHTVTIRYHLDVEKLRETADPTTARDKTIIGDMVSKIAGGFDYLHGVEESRVLSINEVKETPPVSCTTFSIRWLTQLLLSSILLMHLRSRTIAKLIFFQEDGQKLEVAVNDNSYVKLELE